MPMQLRRTLVTSVSAVALAAGSGLLFAAPAGAAGHAPRLTLKVSKPRVAVGHAEVFSGQLASHKRGVEIDVAMKGDSQWLDVGSTKTTRHGKYRIVLTPKKAGRYVFEAHNLLSDYSVTATSRKVVVKVV